MPVNSSRAPKGGVLGSLIIALAAFCGGCSHAEYDLIQPPALAQHIGGKTVTVRREPVEYRLTSVDDHLVVQIYNQSTQPITLLGGSSTIVDPEGQTHPLSGRVIVSHSFIKLILPPVRPISPSAEPFGFHRGYYGPEFPYDGDPFWDGPPYYPDPFFASPPSPVYDDDPGAYWKWDHGDVRLVLVYLNGMLMPPGPPPSAPTMSTATEPATVPSELPPESFTHEFVFRQQKL